MTALRLRSEFESTKKSIAQRCATITQRMRNDCAALRSVAQRCAALRSVAQKLHNDLALIAHQLCSDHASIIAQYLRN
jgi:hypothetical protein